MNFFKSNCLTVIFVLLLFGCSKKDSSVNESLNPTEKIAKDIPHLSSSQISISPSLSNSPDIMSNTGSKILQYDVENESSFIGLVKINASIINGILIDYALSSCGINSFKALDANQSCVIAIRVNSDILGSGLYPIQINALDPLEGNILSSQQFVSISQLEPSSPNGNGGSSPVCKVNYHLDQRRCIPNARSCSVLPSNASAGVEVWNGSSFNSCQITECMSDKKIFNNACVDISRSCLVMPNHAITATEAIINNIIGNTIQGSSLEYGECIINQCEEPTYIKVNNACVQKDQSDNCPIDNGIGIKLSTDGGQTFGQCTVSDCDTGYSISLGTNSCIEDVQSCTLQNYYTLGGIFYDPNITGVAGTPPSCSITSCVNGYVPNSNFSQCIVEELSCTVQNSALLAFPISNVANPSTGTGIGSGLGSNTTTNTATILSNPDGSFFIAGSYSLLGGKNNYFTKFDVNGNLDSNFNKNGRLLAQPTTNSQPVFAIAKKADGKLLVGGFFTSYQGNTINYLAQLNADGSYDSTSTFNTNVGTKISGGRVAVITIQNDGKILVGGSFTTYNGAARVGLLRLNADGTPDTVFNGANSGVNGVGAITAGTSGFVVRSILLDNASPQKIYVGGSFSAIGGASRVAVARLLSTGGNDSTFTSPLTNIGSYVSNMLFDSSGRLFIGGKFCADYTNATSCYSGGGIWKLTTTGAIDVASFNSFYGNTTPAFNNEVLSMKIDASNNIYAVGTFATYKGVAVNKMVKLNSAGVRDASFNPTAATTSNLAETVSTVGTPDNTLGDFTTGTPTVTNPIFMVMDLQPTTGKIIAAGSLSLFYDLKPVNNIVRLAADGSLDTTFARSTGFANKGPSGIARNQVNITKIKFDGSNKMLVGSGNSLLATHFKDQRIAAGLVRLNTDGMPDSNWTQKVLFASSIGVSDILIKDDGTILVAGDMEFKQNYNAWGNRYLAHLNSNGLNLYSNQTTNDSKLSGGAVHSLVLQPVDRKIIAVGAFNTYGASTPARQIIRYNHDITPDTTFNVGGYGLSGNATSSIQVTTPVVFKARIQKDNKIIIGGRFNQYNLVDSPNLSRLNPNGEIDQDFANNIGAIGFADTTTPNNAYIRDIELLQNNRILIGGRLTMYNGVTLVNQSLVALNMDGTLNTSFNNNLGTAFPVGSIIYSIKEQPDGKIMIGGSFTSFNGVSSLNILRLNSDGTLDTTFNVQANGVVFDIYVKENGKYVIGGAFNEINGKLGIDNIAYILDNKCVPGFEFGF